MHENLNMEALLVAARTVYAEARSETRTGRLMVAQTLWNRVFSPVRWWGTTLQTVCLKPWQFSCWNPRTVERVHPDANYNAMMRVSDRRLYDYVDLVLEAHELQEPAIAEFIDTDWREPIRDRMLHPRITHYANKDVVLKHGKMPRWMHKYPAAFTEGRHTFYVCTD